MSTLIRRTNPDKKKAVGGALYSCAACQSDYATADLARSCAERDHGFIGEYRPAGTRNFIRLGDTVKCKPASGTSFRAIVKSIRQVNGAVREVEVYGGKSGYEKVRTFFPDQISRVAQSKVEAR